MESVEQTGSTGIARSSNESQVAGDEHTTISGVPKCTFESPYGLPQLAVAKNDTVDKQT